MAGFFGLFDYTKEGKGVYPDDPPKGPISTFFSVLGRKFWKICTINILYVVFSLPALILAFFSASFVVQTFLPGMTVESLVKLFEESGLILQEGVTMQDFANVQMLQIFFITAMFLVGLSLVIVGPVHAGVTYVLRNYSREEHAFVWLDFKENALKNLKQSLISGLISVLLTFIFVVNFSFYSSSSFISNDILRVFLKTLVVILFILWCMVQMYLYPMMVTFQLTLKQLLKNCMLFSILRLPLNILMLFFSTLILFVIPGVLLFMGYGITVMLAGVWYVVLAFGLNLLMTNFFVYRALDKYMIKRIRDAESLNEETDGVTADVERDDEEDESSDEEDGRQSEEEAEKGGFVPSPSPSPSKP